MVNLNRAPIALQYRALNEGLLVYEGDYFKHSDFIEYVIKSYPDYAVKYAIFAHDYEQALKEEYDDVIRFSSGGCEHVPNTTTLTYLGHVIY